MTATCMHCGHSGADVQFDSRYVGGVGYVNGDQCVKGCDQPHPEHRTVAQITQDWEYDYGRIWTEDATRWDAFRVTGGHCEVCGADVHAERLASVGSAWTFAVCDRCAHAVML